MHHHLTKRACLTTLPREGPCIREAEERRQGGREERGDTVRKEASRVTCRDCGRKTEGERGGAHPTLRKERWGWGGVQGQRRGWCKKRVYTPW